MAIPEVIYQTYFTSRLPLTTRLYIWRMKRLNPTYRYEFYDDERIEAFLEEKTTREICSAYRRINIGAAKADFFRYAVLYTYGGIYLDIDSAITKDLHTLIEPDDSAIISREKNPGLFVQWALIYEKGHPFLARTMDNVLDNIRCDRFPNDVHRMTGPSVYSQSIIECLAQDSRIKYREFGFDYDGYFRFKHPLSRLLYRRKEHWRKTQSRQPVLKQVASE